MSPASAATKRALKVLVVTLRYPPYVAGGYELLTRDAVLALRERGHEVSVLSGQGEALEGVPGVYPWLQPNLDGDPDLFARSFEGTNRERWGLHFYSRANARATERALRESGAELLFYFNLGLVSLAPIVVARRAGVACLGYISDPWPLNHWLQAWKQDERQRSKALRLWLLGRMWSGFSRWVRLGSMLCCSDFLGAKLMQGGLCGARVQTLHLGVPPDMEALAESCSLPERQPGEALRIACISSFWEGKGQSVLLAALERLHTRGLDFRLTLAGAGSGLFLERLRAQAEGLGERVDFREDLDRAAISELLAASHVLVVPSTWDEPFPLASLEGMAHGCAVVLTSAGGSQEAIEPSVHGLLVPPGDVPALAQALESLEQDEPLRRRMGQAARARVRAELSHSSFVDGLERAMFRELEPGN